MKNGTVKFFNTAKGFGFVVDDETKKEFFVHVSGVLDQITEGDRVEYEVEEGKKGFNAVRVKKI
jgi:CspA family cold shock protein